MIHLHVTWSNIKHDLLVELLFVQFEFVLVLAFERQLQLTVCLGDEGRQLTELLAGHDLSTKRGMLRQSRLEPLQALLFFSGVVIPEKFCFLRTNLHLIVFFQACVLLVLLDPAIFLYFIAILLLLLDELKFFVLVVLFLLIGHLLLFFCNFLRMFPICLLKQVEDASLAVLLRDSLID